jgi:hypothetical protein
MDRCSNEFCNNCPCMGGWGGWGGRESRIQDPEWMGRMRDEGGAGDVLRLVFQIPLASRQG